MKKLIVFDLDGTLAASKSSLDTEMASLLHDLLGIVRVAVISGGAWLQFEKQVLSKLPQDESLKKLSPQAARATFAEIGAAESSSHGENSRHPFMHRTETIDYGIIIEGELTLIMDEGEAVVRAGDIVVQRGTNHGWANRSGRNCRVAFILIDGAFEDGLGSG